MKKNRIMIAVAVLTIAAAMLTGCATSVEQDLTNYLQQFTPIAELDASIRDSYNSAVQENYVDDATLLSNLVDNVIPSSDSLVEAVNAMTYETEEVGALHAKYIEAVTMQNEAFTALADALSNADADAVTAAIDMVSEAQAMIEAFVADATAMATEYGLTE